jgi:hypothetical protein
MATHSIYSASLTDKAVVEKINFITRFNAFADGQQNWAIAWWFAALGGIGGFVLPITFLIVYSLGGPVIPFLAISMVSFFACIIANMAGMGIRSSLATLFFSLGLHILMILATVLFF